jgi:hypothetical protein
MEDGDEDNAVRLGGVLDMNMDDVAFRLRVREMLRARQAGAIFCDDEWQQVPHTPRVLPNFCSESFHLAKSDRILVSDALGSFSSH